MIGYLPRSTQRIINEECSEGHVPEASLWGRTPIFVPYGIKSFDLIMINLKMKYDKHFTFKNGWETIMINNSSLRKWDRLAKKQLNQQFLNEIIQGLNCSSFEASAILETVHKVYAPYFVPKGSPRENKWSFKAWSNTFPGGFY